MISSYEITLYIFAIFCTVYGILFFLASANTPPPPNPNRQLWKWALNTKTFTLCLAITYVAMAHFSIYSSLALDLDQGYNSPCENVVANSTYVNTSLTSYQYTNSCAGQTAPAINENIFTIYTWMMIIEFIILMLGTMLLAMRWFFSKW
jgi:hypothetical protein